MKVKSVSCVVGAILCSGVASAQPYGSPNPTPVAAFFDGALPSSRPMSPETSTWQVVKAFPALSFPDTTVISANPSDNRLYIGSRSGEVWSTPNTPDALPSDLLPFLDARDRTAVVWDAGFLGLAFHPMFGVAGQAGSRYVFVYYASPCPIDALEPTRVDLLACDPEYPRQSTGGFFNAYNRLSRFELAAGETEIDPETEKVLLSIRLYNGSHRGGGLVFGDDGYLYLSIGDQFRYTTAQDIAGDFEGGVMRLDVDVLETAEGWSCPSGSHLPRRTLQQVTLNTDEVTGQFYCIPDDNPFVDPTGGVFEEHYTLGNRAPHRLTKDMATGRLWSGEIGENTREEINVIASGNNYGWPFREGTTTGVRSAPESHLGQLTEPVVDFTRAEARAIIGGHVYRGAKFPELAGYFLAGDYATNRLYSIAYDEVSRLGSKQAIGTFSPTALATWGQDNAGEVFLGSVGAAGDVFTLARVGMPIADPAPLLSQLGVFDDLQALDFHDACLPYDLNEPFWSDGAHKRRCVFLPQDGTFDSAAERVTLGPNGDLSFPVGSVFVKHFELPIDARDPTLRKRLETRLLVNTGATGYYGLTYRWRDDESDAELLTDATTRTLTLHDAAGTAYEQTWHFPSRDQCLTCHSRGAGGALGPKVHGLNRELAYGGGVTAHQLGAWNDIGVFSEPLTETALADLPRAPSQHDVTAPLQARARSYLDANCSYCHRPETGNRASMDVRFTTELLSTGTIWAGVSRDFGIAGAHLITPGSAETSLVYRRATLLGDDAMPPLAKHVVDAAGVELLAAWIDRLRPELPRNGLAYAYYELDNPTALPNFANLEPVATGEVATFDVSVRERNDDFGLVFSGYVEIPSDGAYTFFTTSDDGSQLFIDGQLVVDNDGLHGPTEESGQVTLEAGYHELVVTMFENAGGEMLSVSWQQPGKAKSALSPATLYPDIPEPVVNSAPLWGALPDRSGLVGQNVDVELGASDDDGDWLYFDAAGLPPGLALDPDTGSITGLLGAEAVGSHVVTVSVSDGPEIDVGSFTWHIETEPSGGEGGAPSMAGAGSGARGGETGAEAGAPPSEPGASGGQPGQHGEGGGGADESTSQGGAPGSTSGGAGDSEQSGRDEGCGCRLGAAREPQGFGWGLAWLLLSVLRRRAGKRRREQAL